MTRFGRMLEQWQRRRLEKTTAGRERIFRKIYAQAYWSDGETRSGDGSMLENTGALRAALPELLRELQVRTFLDLPCGDFNWLKEVDLSGVDYIGADIVRKVVQRNQKCYAGEGRRFVQLDIVADSLPRADLVMVRDLFNHMPFEQIHAALDNMRRSGIKYLLVGHYTEVEGNDQLEFTGKNRLLNFEKPPFAFPPPQKVILEDFQPHLHLGRSMALWALANTASASERPGVQRG